MFKNMETLERERETVNLVVWRVKLLPPSSIGPRQHHSSDDECFSGPRQGALGNRIKAGIRFWNRQRLDALSTRAASLVR